MTTEARIEKRSSELPPARVELSLARIRTPQKTWDGAIIPAGTTGTIVETLGGGQDYVLDFVEPYDAIATVRSDQLEDSDES